MRMPKNIYEECPLLSTKSIIAIDKLIINICDLIIKTYINFDNDIANLHPINFTQLLIVNLIVNQLNFSFTDDQTIPEKISIIQDFLDLVCNDVMEIWLTLETHNADVTIAN